MESAIFALYKQDPRPSAVSPRLSVSLDWYRKVDGSDAEAKPDYHFTQCLIFEFYCQQEMLRIKFFVCTTIISLSSYVAKCNGPFFASQRGLPSSRKC
jgi:hypothetical protein